MSETNKLRDTLVRIIKSHIETAGLSQKDAAEKAGVTAKCISKISRHNGKGISSDMLGSIIERLGYRIDSIIGHNDGHEIRFVSAGSQAHADKVAEFVDVLESVGTTVVEVKMVDVEPIQDFDPEVMTYADLVDNPDEFYAAEISADGE